MKIIVTGVTGQCGSYMLDQLLDMDHEVIGIKRRSSTNNLWRIQHRLDHKNFCLLEADILDGASLSRLISKVEPPFWIFHFACQSFVKDSFNEPSHTIDTIIKGTLNLLEIIREHPQKHLIRMHNSSSSEMYGDSIDEDGFQRETTRFAPNSPYAVGKVAAHHLCQLYRRAYNIHVSNSITFNMESPRRGEEFVTRKITRYVSELSKFKSSRYGMLDDFPSLKLGNLDAKRDWQFCGDAMRGIYSMVQQNEPDDYVFATGNTFSIKDFLELAFAEIGLDWQRHVIIDENLKRPSEVNILRGDYSKAQKKLGWSPKVDLRQLVVDMVRNEPSWHCPKNKRAEFFHPDAQARCVFLSKLHEN